MPSSLQDLASFAPQVVAWQRTHGRHHLPWQNTQDPYRVWLSEIMLQQTQVATVLAYYTRFLERFPTVASLAQAEQEDVMPYWAGLGYYARARNLHRCAQTVMLQWDGQFPTQAEQLASLPGIGRSTAAAIAAFCFGARTPIMDGNVKRVFTRYFGVYGETQKRAVEQALWTIAEDIVAQAPGTLDMAAYTQGLMDLGSQCCTRTKPDCQRCPLQSNCYARLHQVQNELPTKKQRKQQDERYCHMLIVRSGDEILLEQRPDQGIWGGLLSLPEVSDENELMSLARHYDPHAEPIRLASFQHVFSHFKLHISPWLCQVKLPMLAEPQTKHSLWMPTNKLDQAALPAPVRKVLDGLFPPSETALF